MITSNNSGTPLFYYSKKVISENKNLDFPISRKQRRKMERRLSKKVNKFLENNTN